MRIVASVALCLLSAPAAFAGDSTVTLTTTTGQVVEVTAEALMQAYQQTLHHGLNTADSVQINGDGTFTLNRPRFRYNGGDYPIVSYSTYGACLDFGFNAYVYHEIEYPLVPTPCVSIANVGFLGSVSACGPDRPVFATLTCANVPPPVH